MAHFYENVHLRVAAGRVTAVTRRGGSPVQPDRRSEIGSHATPKTHIFIDPGELEKAMRHILPRRLSSSSSSTKNLEYDDESEAGLDPVGSNTYALGTSDYQMGPGG